MKPTQYVAHIVLCIPFLCPAVSLAPLPPQPLPPQSYHIYKNSKLVPNTNETIKKAVLITIDDGPSPRTGQMMNVLKKHNAKAIFFVNGINDKKYPGVIKSLAESGFTVGNHTWSHANLKKERDESIIQKELDTNTELIKKETGRAPRFFRPPYAEFNAHIKKTIQEKGMVLMNWSGSVKDWEKASKEKSVFIKNITNTVHDGEIILMHEYSWTAEYLDELLIELKKKGYSFIDPNTITT